jgi:SAM-dependent methyltransferase
MSLLGKIQKKLVEFSQAPDKGAWLYDLWKWRYFAHKHKQQAQLNLLWDREHGVETAGELQLETAGVPLADVARGNGVYRPLTENLFRESMASIGVDASRFTFVDIGSGKGKVLFMAADFPFKHIVGVEYAAGLHEVAARNVTTYRSDTQKCRCIEPVHADALTYRLPDGPLVLFIFNALAKEIMRDLLKKLDGDAGAQRDRPLILIYTNIRNVAEVGDVFDGLQNLRAVRRAKNFVVIANESGARSLPPRD